MIHMKHLYNLQREVEPSQMVSKPLLLTFLVSIIEKLPLNKPRLLFLRYLMRYSDRSNIWNMLDRKPIFPIRSQIDRSYLNLMDQNLRKMARIPNPVKF